MAWHLDGVWTRIDLFRRAAIATLALSVLLAWGPGAANAQGSHWTGQHFTGKPYYEIIQPSIDWGACQRACAAERSCVAWTAERTSYNSQRCKFFGSVTQLYAYGAAHSGTIGPRTGVTNPTQARITGPRVNGIPVGINYRACGGRDATACDMWVATTICAQRGYSRYTRFDRDFGSAQSPTWDLMNNNACPARSGCVVMREVACAK